jgi:hypothetical protein
MHQEPAPGDPGRDEDPAGEPRGPVEPGPAAWEPVVTRPDPMSEEEQQAALDAVTDQDAPWWTDSSTDPATDWFQLAYAGDNSLGVMFFWAPTGVNLNLCAADPGDGHVVLRVCNGSNWQRWIAAPVGSTGFFTWTNRATHRILQSGAKGAQLVTVTQSSMISGNQQWKFSA